MSKRDLVFRVLDQKPAERVPVGFWFHFAEPDRLLDYSPETIEANRSGHLRFIREFEPDILKIMTDGFFIYPNETLKALTAPADLDRVEATHPTKWIDDQVALARELVEAYGREAAIFFNIFSPSTHIMFQSRAWKKPLLTQETLLRKNPEGYAHALGEIAKDLGELIRRVIGEAGVDGIYLSVRSVANIPAADYARYIAPSELALLSAANEYNRTLAEQPLNLEPTEAEMADYLAVLPGDDGIMGHISIPNIGVELMIYHTVEEPVLQVGAGHLPGTSLPVGGKGTHCALSGHTGLTTAALFTNLDRLEVGDYFYLTVLDDVLTYQIEDISVVLPWELDSLAVDPERDLCTLITCTPYGINSHRLLVTGTRVPTPRQKNDDGSYGSYTIYTPVHDRTDPSLAEWMALAGTVILAAALIFWIVKLIRKHKRGENDHETQSI